jgi:murein DD-endopeptidase MepM/ murein hydrolase activator NlpD
MLTNLANIAKYGHVSVLGYYRALLLAMALNWPGGMPLAQTGYKYRGPDGEWVFTDRAPAPGEKYESIPVERSEAPPTIAVVRSDDGGYTQLTAVNECLCVVTFIVGLPQPDSKGTDPPALTNHYYVLQPHTRQTVLQRTRAPGPDAEFPYRWKAALGSPDAVHAPERPYRVPYGVGSSYLITQAYPSRITHGSPDSQYAIDFALPDGTPVYAARDGTVIYVRHDAFRGAPVPALLDQANVVEVLHDDGTIGVYAHLHWDSIRVRVGAHVSRGEYIANSGNTGFSSGPHLHFAVIVNERGSDVSVPVQFAGLAGVPVSAVDRTMLTAY